MIPEKLLVELKYNDGTFPRSALKQAIAQQETITPYLLEVLEQAKRDPEAILDEPAYMLHIYALYLLAQFRETRAYPLIIQLFSVSGELSLDLTGDVVTEDLGRILASLCGGDLEPIKTLIEDRNANEYVRSAGLTALLTRYAQGFLTRTELIDYFRTLFTRLPKEPNYIWSSLVANSTRICPIELQTEIEDVYKEGLIEEFFVRLKDVKESIAAGPESALQNIRNNHHYELIDDTIAELEYWACFDKAPATAIKPIPPEKPAPKRKIGRNEPCPCGSGKKYKKCCLLK